MSMQLRRGPERGGNGEPAGALRRDCKSLVPYRGGSHRVVHLRTMKRRPFRPASLDQGRQPIRGAQAKTTPTTQQRGRATSGVNPATAAARAEGGSRVILLWPTACRPAPSSPPHSAFGAAAKWTGGTLRATPTGSRRCIRILRLVIGPLVGHGGWDSSLGAF